MGDFRAATPKRWPRGRRPTSRSSPAPTRTRTALHRGRTSALADYAASARRRYREIADDYLALYPASTDEEAGLQSNAAARDHARTSTSLWASEWSKHASSPVYTYFWTHVPPGPDAESRGAYHGSEINYVLNNLYATERPWAAEDHRIAETVSRYIVNFAAAGDPNGPGLPQWAPGQSGRTGNDGDRRPFWSPHGRGAGQVRLPPALHGEPAVLVTPAISPHSP